MTSCLAAQDGCQCQRSAEQVWFHALLLKMSINAKSELEMCELMPCCNVCQRQRSAEEAQVPRLVVVVGVSTCTKIQQSILPAACACELRLIASLYPTCMFSSTVTPKCASYGCLPHAMASLQQSAACLG